MSKFGHFLDVFDNTEVITEWKKEIGFFKNLSAYSWSPTSFLENKFAKKIGDQSYRDPIFGDIYVRIFK